MKAIRFGILNRPVAVLLLASGLIFNPLFLQAQPAQFDFDKEVEKTSRLIVMLQVEYEGTPEFGAGIIFGRQQDRLLIATAYHLLHRGPQLPQHIRVQLRDKPGKLLEAKLLREEAALDLAVLSVEALAKQGINACSLPFDRLGQAAELRRGEGVFAVGNPNGVSWALPVMADQVALIIDHQIVFQSAFISSGHSGGGLLDEQALLVGMTTADQPPFGRAINLDTMLQQVKQWKYPVHLGPHQHLSGGGTPLHVAAERGDVAAIKKLLANCGDPNAADDEKLSPLHFAAMRGNVEAMTLLLQAGANVDAQDIGMDTPLHHAANNGQLEGVKWLLKSGAQVNSQGYKGATPLHKAAGKSHLEIAKLLLAAGADLNLMAQDPYYGEHAPLISPLATAAKEGQPEMIRILLSAGARIDENVLYYAAEEGEMEILKFLLGAGARIDEKVLHYPVRAGRVGAVRTLLEAVTQVNGKVNFSTRRLLHPAVHGGKVEIVKLLVKAGAEVNTRDDQNRTPLFTAIYLRKDTDIEDFLIAQGGNIKGATAEEMEICLRNAVKGGRLAATKLLIAEGTNVNKHHFSQGDSLALLHLAIAQHDVEIVKVLLKAGADIREVAAGMTALQRAAEIGDADIIHILLGAGAKVNETGSPRYGTPLKLAASGRFSRHVEAVKVLLKAGANANAGAGSGERVPGRPLEIAVRNEQEKIVQLLLAAGADVNAETSDHRTLLATALSQGNRAVIALLRAHGARE